MKTREARPASDDADTRLRCRRCGCPHLPVYYTRHRNGTILRTRYCRHCGLKRVTREQ